LKEVEADPGIAVGTPLVEAPEASPARAHALAVPAMVAVAGGAALSWEVVWQLHASLALGASAKAAAVVLIATMSGMMVGSVFMGRLLRGRWADAPLRVYGTLELIVGLSGLVLAGGFRVLERLDGALFLDAPGSSVAVRLAGILLVLGPPTVAMGASIPVFGLLARRSQRSIATLYAVNTGGAAAGALVVALVLLPELGVALTTRVLALLDALVCASAWLIRLPDPPAAAGMSSPDAGEAAERRPGTIGRTPTLAPGMAWAVVFSTGAVTFALEVAWFRSLRAAFQSTTDTFAIMLASVLLPLAVGARLAPGLRARRVELGTILGAAGVLTLLATPVVERFDIITGIESRYWVFMGTWFATSLAVLGPPILLLGVALPWLLEEQRSPGRWGQLYAVNTLGAIVGSIGAAWMLLPGVGATATAWIAGAVLVVVATGASTGRVRQTVLVAGAVALGLAMVTASGVGRMRVQGRLRFPVQRVLGHHETPDATVAAVEYGGGSRALVVDGFVAALEHPSAHYMEWMGRLPMLLHPSPGRALVIAFGTGQTSNGVRLEGPAALDVVDLNEAVFRLAPFFATNQGVLLDPRVRQVVMDGRAWLRRSRERYDVVTLEPMPPYFAGVNSLYSLEFYRLAAARMNPGGVIAQWLPLHLLPPHHATSVAATFRAVFPDSILWIDPVGRTGILLGRREQGTRPLGVEWPGLRRPAPGRLRAQVIADAVALDTAGLARYAAIGGLVTDDNQLLAYGRARQHMADYGTGMEEFNLLLVAMAREGHRP
jgi:spermidine synthase